MNLTKMFIKKALEKRVNKSQPTSSDVHVPATGPQYKLKKQEHNPDVLEVLRESFSNFMNEVKEEGIHSEENLKNLEESFLSFLDEEKLEKSGVVDKINKGGPGSGRYPKGSHESGSEKKTVGSLGSKDKLGQSAAKLESAKQRMSRAEGAFNRQDSRVDEGSGSESKLQQAYGEYSRAVSEYKNAKNEHEKNKKEQNRQSGTKEKRAPKEKLPTFQERYPDAKMENIKIHSSGLSEEDAKVKAMELRSKGIYSSLWHQSGPRTGKKSRYFVLTD